MFDLENPPANGTTTSEVEELDILRTKTSGKGGIQPVGYGTYGIVEIAQGWN